MADKSPRARYRIFILIFLFVSTEWESDNALWPHTDPVVLSIGQLAWMNYDNLLLALRPLLLDYGITPEKAAKLIEDAQENLYHPKVCVNLGTPTSTVGGDGGLGANIMVFRGTGSTLLLLAHCPCSQSSVNIRLPSIELLADISHLLSNMLYCILTCDLSGFHSLPLAIVIHLVLAIPFSSIQI